MNICILTNDRLLGNELAKNFIVKYNHVEVDNFEVVVLVSYGSLIPKSQLKHRLYLNVHNSLLPKYRGLHAFSWALINGESKLGYTLHIVDSSIDAGDIISQIEFPVSLSNNINDVFKKSKKIFIKWITKELITLTHEKIKKAIPQNHHNATYFARRKPEDNLIDWNQPARNIHNFIRALTPPYTEGAFTYFQNQKVNIIESEMLNTPCYIERVGKIVNKDKNGIWVKAIDTVILIRSIRINEKIYQGNEIEFKIGHKFRGYN